MKQNILRKKTFILLLIITPLGFLFKFYRGPYFDWFNNYGAGILYEMFWILLLFSIKPRRVDVWKIPIIVLMVTVFLELMQLWHPLFLENIRNTFLGQTLLGQSFSLWDIPHYIIGCLAGWICLRRLFLIYGEK